MASHILFNKTGQGHPEQLSDINITQRVHESFVHNVGWLNNGGCCLSKELYYYSRIFLVCVKLCQGHVCQFSSQQLKQVRICLLSHFFPQPLNILNQKKMKTSLILPSISLKLTQLKTKLLVEQSTLLTHFNFCHIHHNKM